MRGPDRLLAFRATDPGNCLLPVILGDTRFAPELEPGDRLVPVTCATRKPVYGEYVLVRETNTLRLARFIELRGKSGRPPLLVWDGDGYTRHAEEALRGRILSVMRGDRTWDLNMPRAWPGRDRIAVAAHRALARCLGSRA